MSRSSTQFGRSRLGLETLEAREVPAVVFPPKGTPPDHAGSTPATSAVVMVSEMGEVKLTDYLPSSTDIDYYKVHLSAGDFLSAAVKSTGTAALNGSLAVYDSGNNLITQSLYVPGRITFGGPSVGFYAGQEGDFFVRATTAGAEAGTARRYDITFDRVGLIESAAPSVLDKSGAYHAWLNKAGDTLSISGPSGYGFSLRGSWSAVPSGDTMTYTATGRLYLKTAALASAGEIALQVSDSKSFSVSTHISGRVQLGELSKITGNFGLSLAPVAGAIKDQFGLDVSSLSILDGWSIKTGAQIKQQYQSYVQRDIDQLLDGVPYLVYGNAGDVKINFGNTSLTTTDQAKTVLIADPADPFLYVAYKNYAAAGSAHGRIPFNAVVNLPTDPTTVGGPLAGDQPEFYGHVYAAGTYPISGLPLTVNGDITVDLDANHDGQYLGGAGNASQLFHGDLNALANVARDINLGVNGGLNLGYTVAGVNVSVPLGQASAFYSGPRGEFSFKGAQGTAINPWQGTVLSKFQVGPGTTVEGIINRDGRFSVSTTSNYRFFTCNAAMTITVTDHDITAAGQLQTPIFTADVSGSIGFNGNFTWTGMGHLGIGTDANHIRGDADFILTKNSSGMTLSLDLDCEGKLSIPGFRLKGDVTGHLKMKVDNSGHVTYDVGSLAFDCDLYIYNPFTQKYNDLGSAGISISLNGKHVNVRATAGGHSATFSFNLP